MGRGELPAVVKSDKQGELGRRDVEFPLKCSCEIEVFLGILYKHYK